MRILRSVVLSIGLMGLAVGCGGSSKGEETTPAANPCGGNPCGGDMADPCAADPCGGDWADPCGGDAADPCGGDMGDPCGEEMSEEDPEGGGW